VTSHSSDVNLCPVCNRNHIVNVIHINQVPIVCNSISDTRQKALDATLGDIALAFCRHCGHIFNLAFDTAQIGYTEDYENSLHFSPRFQEYATALASNLVNRYGLFDKDILEIGSGRGDFLKLLVELGQNRGMGFDPSYPGPAPEDEIRGLTFVQDYYDQHYAGFPADFILSRHVLEHIPQPGNFLRMLRSVIGERLETVIFFEVPNVFYTLHDLGIWDLIYEHCSYFSASSLAEAFRCSGFEVLQTRETFEGQFLTVEARPAANGISKKSQTPAFLGAIAQDVDNFAENYRQKVEAWKMRLYEFRRTGKRVVIWGAGSKGISFLNTLKSLDVIEYVVDINPRKQGKFISGTGQKIVSPSFLRTYQPQVVILMNRNYEGEIRQQLQDMGLDAEIAYA
jgi:SAM-dependent methyltransferase